MANLNLNKVILGGRLTSDVELKTTTTGVSVAQFSLAVNRKYSKEGEQQTDFINCTAWRGTAEFIAKYFKKGSSLCVVGSIQVRSWTDNNNQKRYATDIVVDEAMFVDSKNDTQTANNITPDNYIPDAYKVPEKEEFQPVDTDSDLPF